MKRIAIIAPFIMTLALDASASVKVIKPPKPAPQWFIAIVNSEEEFYGPFHKLERAAEFCAKKTTEPGDCQVAQLKAPIVAKKVGGGK